MDVQNNPVELSEEFLAELVVEFSDGCVGLGLTGSLARGEGTPLSDVDLLCFYPQPPVEESQRYRLVVRRGWLVSLSGTTAAEKTASLARPQEAVWAVPGLRQMRILFDPLGELALLKQAADDFLWQPLQAEANIRASWDLMGYAEEVHKVVSGLAHGKASSALYGSLGLVLGLSRAAAYQRGLFIRSDNDFLAQVLEEIGAASAWSSALQVAAGFTAATVWERAEASLRLYVETASLFDGIIAEVDRPVIDLALATIAKYWQSLP